LAISAMVGCDGGGDSPPSTAELQADWNARCESFATECPDPPRDPEKCKAEWPCLEAAMRPDMLVKTVACTIARTCEGSDDACSSVEVQGITPSAKAAAFKQACLDRKTECSGLGDDYCYVAQAMKDELIVGFEGCLTLECADIEACFDTKLAEGAPSCADSD